MSDQGLTYSSNEGGREGFVVMKLVGPLVLQNIFSLQGELRTNKPPVMIFDLSEVPYMDSAGIGVLINYYVAAEKNDRRMALVGANERLEALLVLTKVQGMLRNFPTLEEALAKA
jgi:anti-anti-sigma factor